MISLCPPSCLYFFLTNVDAFFTSQFTVWQHSLYSKAAPLKKEFLTANIEMFLILMACFFLELFMCSL